MQADVLTFRRVAAARQLDAQRGTHLRARMVQTSKLGRLDTSNQLIKPELGNKQRQAIKPALIQQQTQDIGQQFVEKIWEGVSPGSLLIFKLSERLALSPSITPEDKNLAGWIGAGAFVYGLSQLIKKLNN